MQIFKIHLKSTSNSIHFFNKYFTCLSGIVTITWTLSNIFRTWKTFPTSTYMYPTFWYSSCIFSFCIIFWTLSSRWEKNLGSISAPFVWGGTGLGISSNSNNVREQTAQVKSNWNNFGYKQCSDELETFNCCNFFFLFQTCTQFLSLS